MPPKRTKPRLFLVRTDDNGDDGDVAIACSGIPHLLSTFSATDNALCIKRGARQHASSPNVWVVTCNYSTDLGLTAATPEGGDAGQGGQLDENPLNRPPELEWNTVRYTYALDTDWQGRVIQNTAGERFDPPLVEEAGYLCLSFAKNIPIFDPYQISHATYAVNREPFLGFEIGEVLCDQLSGKPSYENGVFFWHMAGRFVFNPIEWETVTTSQGNQPIQVGGGWDRRVLNAGFEERILLSSETRRITLPGGQYPASPRLLNQNGYAFSSAQIAAAGFQPVYLTFRTKRRFNFYNLGVF